MYFLNHLKTNRRNYVNQYRRRNGEMGHESNLKILTRDGGQFSLDSREVIQAERERASEKSLMCFAKKHVEHWSTHGKYRENFKKIFTLSWFLRWLFLLFSFLTFMHVCLLNLFCSLHSKCTDCRCTSTLLLLLLLLLMRTRASDLSCNKIKVTLIDANLFNSVMIPLMNGSRSYITIFIFACQALCLHSIIDLKINFFSRSLRQKISSYNWLFLTVPEKT